MVNQNKNTTNQILADSIKALVLTKPVEKITIKEITDRAGVIRPTFYNHFQDKYELLEWIISTEILEPAHPLIRNGLTNQAVLLIFTSLLREKEFYSRLSRMDGPVSFEDMVVRCIQNVLVEIFFRISAPEKREISVDECRYAGRALCQIHVLCGEGMDQTGDDDSGTGDGRHI